MSIFFYYCIVIRHKTKIYIMKKVNMMKKVKSFNQIHNHKLCRDLYSEGIDGWWLLLEIPDELVDGDHCLQWFYKSWVIENDEDIEDFPVMTKKEVVQWFNSKIDDYNDFKLKRGWYKSTLSD